MQSDSLLQKIEGRVCTLVINRPERQNSLSPELLEKLTSALEELKKADQVRVVVIRGAGDKAFCAGYDLNLFPTREDTGDDTGEKGSITLFESAMEAIVHFPYPVIAMMNGYAFGGGCDLAVSCDIRIGADDIRIGIVPAKLGVVYSATGLSRFIRVLGQARTRELFFTGRHYSASILKDIGYLNYMLPQDELEPFTYRMAQEISENAPMSLKGIKKVLTLLGDSCSLNINEMQESNDIAENSFRSNDLKEGLAAFFEKRKPVFRGN